MNEDCVDPMTGRLARCVSEAVGVEETDDVEHVCKRWFVAIVQNNTEIASAKKLNVMGYETFVAKQRYVSVWKDGRRKECERVLIPCKILVRCTEEQRSEIVRLSFVSYFMTNIAGGVDKFNRHPIAVVPDAQVEQCKYMLGQTDVKVSFDNFNIKSGTKVRLVRGSLCGLEGIVVDMNSKQSLLYINIEYLGCANVIVDISDVVCVRHSYLTQCLNNGYYGQ